MSEPKQITPADVARWESQLESVEQVIDDVAPKWRRVAAALREAWRERDAWIDTASQAQRGIDYYQSLLDQIASHFGEAAYISDDGSRMEDPLRAKMPELVKALKEERDALRGELDNIWKRCGKP